MKVKLFRQNYSCIIFGMLAGSDLSLIVAMRVAFPSMLGVPTTDLLQTSS